MRLFAALAGLFLVLLVGSMVAGPEFGPALQRCAGGLLLLLAPLGLYLLLRSLIGRQDA